jgi:hypothetical protein
MSFFSSKKKKEAAKEQQRAEQASSPVPFNGPVGTAMGRPSLGASISGGVPGISPHMSTGSASGFPMASSSSNSSLVSQPTIQASPPMLSSGGQPPPGSTIIYPWSLRPLQLIAANLLPDSTLAPIAQSPSPFPRYGHSVNPAASSPSGDLYIFGGLVKDQVRNDLFVLQCAPQGPHGGMQVGLVETRGDVPGPRVGHASVGVGNVLIVWGGDTKMKPDDVQDGGLYLLNLSELAFPLKRVVVY